MRYQSPRGSKLLALLAGALISQAVPLGGLFAAEGEADLILHHGKIITVDNRFSIHQALAVRGRRILRIGSDQEVLATRGKQTRLVDLKGATVLPGLIDSHVHPTAACMTEFDHPIPDMETIQDVLDYIRERAAVVPEGEWVELSQVFITRLREQRYPTREELDRAAPHHPVAFRTGPDAALNSLALKLSGIGKDFRVLDGGAGYAEKDPRTGELTGILRNCSRYIKSHSSERRPTDVERLQRLRLLFKDYNSVGLTGIIDRDASAQAVDEYRQLLASGGLTLRVAISQDVQTAGDIDGIRSQIRKIAADPLHGSGPMLRIVGIKTFLDGGMLTGSAYLRQPWGVSKIYSITDPSYRGLLFIPPDKLAAIVEATVDAGLQFTAHSVGDGAVHTLLDVYENLSRKRPIRQTRPCITHSNFMSREAIEALVRLGVVVDIQPAWLYLDTRTLVAQFGYDRLRYFQPLRSIFEAGALAGGGSDHMQKIGALRAINFYDPFLAMWTTITRRARGYEGQLHPEEGLTREQAIRFYTINNAYLMFLEDQTGSLEPGKLADFVVLDTDLLTCPVDAIPKTRVLQTYVGGKMVYQR
jgi:predicted amidohydrolase YtcJ